MNAQTNNTFVPAHRDPMVGNGALYPSFERDPETKIKTGLKIVDGHVQCALLAGRTRATVSVPAELFGDLSTCKADAKQRQYLPCAFVGRLWKSRLVNANSGDYDFELRDAEIEYRAPVAA